MLTTNLDVSRARSSSETLLPDTELCNAAVEYARIASEPFLFHHVMRSASLADSIGRKSGVKFDREVLCVSAVLHDLGLTKLAAVQMRFEIGRPLLKRLNPETRRSHASATGLEEAAFGFLWKRPTSAVSSDSCMSSHGYAARRARKWRLGRAKLRL
jgi:hypothetical protein